jgi:hypothetical protein
VAGVGPGDEHDDRQEDEVQADGDPEPLVVEEPVIPAGLEDQQHAGERLDQEHDGIRQSRSDLVADVGQGGSNARLEPIGIRGEEREGEGRAEPDHGPEHVHHEQELQVGHPSPPDGPEKQPRGGRSCRRALSGPRVYSPRWPC